ncbi:FadR/GntR family transcriptional regulator [Psychromarinibacter sp. S121]|uniref:FadR/GntR family transcriptional regulator n=1 Tax=Psychromarinibacter sp. S121 TaxID=3415127 RepID=UPI003C79A388
MTEKRGQSEGQGPRVFAPIKVHRTFETIIERIVEAIDAQGLGEGDRLPKEAEMAGMLEVSRPTLRQALRILETTGVLTVKAGQSGGIFVASEMVPLDILGRHIASEVDHIGELIAARRMLEPIVYHMAADNARPEELDRVADAIELMHKHRNEPAMVMRADGVFHRRIAHAAGNHVLLRTMNGIYRELNPLRGALTHDEDSALHMIDVHNRQLAAIRDRDHPEIDRLLEETFVDLEEEFRVSAAFAMRWTPLTRPPGG